MSNKPKHSQQIEGRTLNMMRTKALENYFELQQEENREVIEQIELDREVWLTQN